MMEVPGAPKGYRIEKTDDGSEYRIYVAGGGLVGLIPFAPEAVQKATMVALADKGLVEPQPETLPEGGEGNTTVASGEGNDETESTRRRRSYQDRT